MTRASWLWLAQVVGVFVLAVVLAAIVFAIPAAVYGGAK